MIRASATPQLGNRWSRHLRGHLLLFERRPWPAHSHSAGFRLLVVAAGLEILRLSAVRWLYPRAPLWLLLPLLLGVAMVSVPAIAGVRLSQLGFRRWGEWTTTEKSYFLQVVIIATGLLLIVLAAPLRGNAGNPGPVRSLWGVFVPYLCLDSTRSSATAAWCNWSWCADGACPWASSGRTCCTPSALCISTTLLREPRWPYRCSRPSSSSGSSSACSTAGPATCGSSPAFTRSVTQRSSGAWARSGNLSDAAFYGKNREYALGNTARQRFMGTWSDGVAVKELTVTDHP